MDSRIYILTHKRLTNQLSSSEETELGNLLMSPQNKAISQELSYIWNASNNYFPRQDWGKDAAKKSFLKKIAETTPANRAPHATKNTATATPWLKYIGIGILALAALFLAYKAFQPAKVITASPELEYAQIMGDTKVWIGDDAQLTVLKDSKNERTVALKGDAFFDVEHQPERPFKIDLGNGVFAEVLGTSFSAHSTHGGQAATISVRDGQVKLYSDNNAVILNAGQEGRLDAQSGVTTTEAAHILPLIPQETQITFNAEPMNEVLDQLGKVYGVEFQYDEQMLSVCRYSNVLPADADLDETLASIALIHSGLTFEKLKHSTYAVSGTCE